MLCFSDNTAISYVLLLVLNRQEPVTEQRNFVDLSKISYFWSVVILIRHMPYCVNLIKFIAVIEMSKGSIEIILPKYYTFINDTSRGCIYILSL